MGHGLCNYESISKTKVCVLYFWLKTIITEGCGARPSNDGTSRSLCSSHSPACQVLGFLVGVYIYSVMHLFPHRFELVLRN